MWLIDDKDSGITAARKGQPLLEWVEQYGERVRYETFMLNFKEDSISITHLGVFPKTTSADDDLQSMFDGNRHLVVHCNCSSKGNVHILRNVLLARWGKVCEGLKDKETKTPILLFESVDLVCSRII